MFKLKSVTTKSFMGISQDDPLVVTLPETKKTQVPITVLKGNQGTRKTSLLTSIALALGAAFKVNIDQFKNLKDEAIDIEVLGEDLETGEECQILVSESRTILKKRIGDGKFSNMSSPKELIRQMAGPLGVSPMFLKEVEGKKQIQWFKDAFSSDDEASKKELKLVENLKKKVEDRKETNREIKSLKGWLDESDMFQHYEKNQKKFANPINADKQKAAFELLQKKVTGYRQYENTVAITQGEILDTDNLIADLEQKLKAAKERKARLTESIETGKKWLEDNNGVLKEYDKAQEAWLDLSKDLAAQSTWKEVLKKEKEYNEMLQKKIMEDDDVEKMRKDLLKITKTYLPPIDGLEIQVNTGIDNERAEGIYYNDKTLAQLSESELWDLFMRIWNEKGVRFIFCENINALGSEAIKTLNKLSKDGCTIFATQMDRSKKTIGISFEAKIE
jgi:hypothetical protein